MTTPCPFCDYDCSPANYCDHFVGWTDDGKVIDGFGRTGREADYVRDGDLVVKTGVTARIFRKAVKP